MKSYKIYLSISFKGDLRILGKEKSEFNIYFK